MARKKRHVFKRLRVMADYMSSGIWAAEPTGLFRHGMVEHARLGLPAELAARFRAWIRWYDQQPEVRLEVGRFNAEGLELARALKRHFGPATEVVFAPEADDGGPLPEQVVEAEAAQRG